MPRKALVLLEKSPDTWYNCDVQMPQSKPEKEIFHMAIISHDPYDEQCRSKTISQFSKEFNLGRLLEQSNVRKAKGIGVLTLFAHLLLAVFSGKSPNHLVGSGGFCGKKDTLYRFLNDTSANWLRFLHLLASKIIVRMNSLFHDRAGVLVIDDTLHKRNRSKHVELLTRVRDHNDGRYCRGFRCLTLCYQIVGAIVPVGFRILSSVGGETRINGSREGLDKRTVGYKIRQFAVSNTYDMAFDMLRRVAGMARHVLFDSWFSDPVMFKTLRGMDFHGVGMLQAKKGRLYRHKGKIYNLEALYALAKPFIRQNQGYAAIGAEFGDGTPFSITFVRDMDSKRGWFAIGTTDLSLPPKQVISLYSRRWSIEVFFKTVKSCLGFASECQSRSFDAIVCSVAVVFTRHIVLTWMNLGLPVPETDGQLFFRLYDEVRQCTFPEALEIVIREVVANFVDSDKLQKSSVLEFLRSLPSFFKPLPFVA
jgi:hypothetical protein